MDEINNEELIQQILDALVGQEDKLNVMSDSIDVLVENAEKKFDEECAKLDDWFEKESPSTAEEDKEALQQKYRHELAAIKKNIDEDLKQ